MDPYGTPQEISPKSESLFSVFARNILSEKYDLNHFIVLSENLIALSFCNKISWSIVLNAFCRSINIIPVNKPSSNPFKTLSVKKDKHRFVEWLPRKPHWYLYNISLSYKKAFVWSWITLSMIFEIDGSNEIGLQLQGSVFFPFLKIGFSLAILQALGKTPCEIERLQSAEMGFANMLAASFQNLPESLFQQLWSSQYLSLFSRLFLQ